MKKITYKSVFHKILESIVLLTVRHVQVPARRVRRRGTCLQFEHTVLASAGVRTLVHRVHLVFRKKK